MFVFFVALKTFLSFKNRLFSFFASCSTIVKARYLSAISNTHKGQCPMYPAWMDLLSGTDVATALRKRKGKMRKIMNVQKILQQKEAL